MADATAIAKFADNVRAHVVHMRAVGSPLYEHMFIRMAEDRQMLEFALLEHDPIPMRLFFGAHFMLLDKPEQPVARYFRSLSEDPLPPQEAWPVFRQYCLDHAEELRGIMRTRTVQTTTVERAACLAIALARIAVDGEPVSVIEIGCSAGLLLLFDEYRFDYGPAGALGRADAALTVKLPVHGTGFAAPARLPRVARRIGMDLDPVDPADPQAHRWIHANLFPEWVEQRARLCKALDLRAGYPLETVRGDAIALLPDLLERIRGPVCVMHSGFMNYLSDAQRAHLDATLAAQSRARTVHKIGLDVTLPEYTAGYHRMTLRHTRYMQGAPQETVLGNSDLLGQALNWTG
ncbi:MAG: DUF2332 domain-containing protein [Gammaproteobacteria bacterium]